MRDFRKLTVWQRAHALALAVRKASETLPKRGFNDLRSQMVRSAESIACNIVEGAGSESAREFARFLGIAIKSSTELDYQLQLAREAGARPEQRWTELGAEAVEVRRMLWGLRKTVLAQAETKS